MPQRSPRRRSIYREREQQKEPKSFKNTFMMQFCVCGIILISLAAVNFINTDISQRLDYAIANDGIEMDGLREAFAGMADLLGMESSSVRAATYNFAIDENILAGVAEKK